MNRRRFLQSLGIGALGLLLRFRPESAIAIETAPTGARQVWFIDWSDIRLP